MVREEEREEINEVRKKRGVDQVVGEIPGQDQIFGLIHGHEIEGGGDEDSDQDERDNGQKQEQVPFCFLNLHFPKGWRKIMNPVAIFRALDYNDRK